MPLVSPNNNDNLGIKNNIENRKRLGQYFTGEKLAHLLAVISGENQCLSAIDPMCGSGDMLNSVFDIAPSAKLFGIEIDHSIITLCQDRFNEKTNNKPHLINGDAFNWSTISALPTYNYDLVITNPPYVRYQKLSSNENDNQANKLSSEVVRKNLLNVARKIEGLTDSDREIFISIIRGYSGLSDLAVPSWILCAMLTAIGGTLAMVVPESWLSRDYAYPIHYMLLKLFRIKWVIEDANSIWFPNAQVKTNLIVAQRVSQIIDINSDCIDQSYLHVALPESLIDSRSIVGTLFPSSHNPDGDFFNELIHCSSNSELDDIYGIPVIRRSLKSKLDDIIAVSSESKWLKNCEPIIVESNNISCTERGTKASQVLLDLMQYGELSHFTTIEAMGGRIGQGLRTGANSFFYCDIISEFKEECLVATDKKLGISKISVPRDAISPVLRRQSEFSGQYRLNRKNLNGRVLILENYLHPNDLLKINEDITRINNSLRQTMPEELANFISTVEYRNIGSTDSPKYIPSLSAVKTNVSLNRGLNSRFWYMLPSLARRHIPDLFVPRINHLNPKVFMNSVDPTIIDANFSTIWLESDAKIDSYALLAILNSNWVTVCMELYGTIMGGGALKLEATHLRRLPIPRLSASQIVNLSKMGYELASGKQIQKNLDQIDRLIAVSIVGDNGDGNMLNNLKRIKEEKLQARNKQRRVKQ